MVKAFLRQMTAWCLSIVLSSIIGIGYIWLAITIAAYYYEMRYPVFLGEKDLAYGVEMMLWASVAVVSAIPLVVLSTRFFLNLSKTLQE